jgi:hypothetical protein
MAVVVGAWRARSSPEKAQALSASAAPSAPSESGSRQQIGSFSSAVPDYAISADGQVVVIAGQDELVFRDVHGGAVTRVPLAFDGDLVGLTFLRGGELALSTSKPNSGIVTIRRVDSHLGTARALGTIRVADARKVSLCADGRRAALETKAGLEVGVVDGPPTKLIVPTTGDTAVAAALSRECDAIVYVRVLPFSEPQDLRWVSFDGTGDRAIDHGLYELNGFVGLAFRSATRVVAFRYSPTGTTLLDLPVDPDGGDRRPLASWPSGVRVSELALSEAGSVVYEEYRPASCDLASETPSADGGGTAVRIVSTDGKARPVGWLDAQHFVVVEATTANEARIRIVATDGTSVLGPAVRREARPGSMYAAVTPTHDVLFVPPSDSGGCSISRYEPGRGVVTPAGTVGSPCQAPLCSEKGCIAAEDGAGDSRVFRAWEPVDGGSMEIPRDVRGKNLYTVLSRDGRFLAVFEPAGPVVVQDMRDRTVQRYQPNVDVLQTADFLPGGPSLVVAGVNNRDPAYETRLLQHGVETLIVGDSRYLVEGVLATPDGKALIVGRCEFGSDLWLSALDGMR